MLCVLVCHDGDQWLSTALSALRRQRIRPRHVIAVDTGSTDRTSKVLAEAEDLLDGVLTAPRGTGFGIAVRLAVEHAVERWGDPDRTGRYGWHQFGGHPVDQVTVMVEREGRAARLVVTDTGVGIPRTDQDRVFDRFW